VPDFKTGGPQALHASDYYWTSTQGSASSAWQQIFSDGSQTTTLFKDYTSRRVRPVRRVPVNP